MRNGRLRARGSGLKPAVVAALAIAAASSGLLAQDKIVVLRAARMFDGQEIRTPGVVVVAGTRR